EPWLPINGNFGTVNVDSEEKDPRSLLTLYTLLIKLKKNHSALREGMYFPLEVQAENVFAFIREKDTERILIVLNFDEKEKELSLQFETATVICNATLTAQEGEKLDLQDFKLKGNE